MFDTISLTISLFGFQSPGSSDEAQPEEARPALVMRQVWGSGVNRSQQVRDRYSPVINRQVHSDKAGLS